MSKVVKITVQGGVIQDVDVPEGVQVVVHDYDTDGTEPERLSRDESGDECVVNIWEHDGQAC